VIDRPSVLITGATGFIGSYLVRRLLSDGYKVFAVSRKLDQSFTHPCLIWVTWNSYFNDIPKNEVIYAVLNLATTYGHNSESETDIFNSNVELPIKLFRYAIAMGAKKIINTDSFFGKPAYDYQHLKTYISSKNQLVEHAKGLIKDKQISFINLRLEHVFGANDGQNKFVTSLIRNFYLKNKRIALTDGMQKRDFVYVDDVVRAYVAVLSNQNINGFTEYEVGSGKSIELKQFCLKLAEEFNVPSSILNFGELEHRANEIMDSSADISPLVSIGWHPKWDLTSALSDLVKNQLPLN
jgi:CDP-abequose synthase